MRKNIRGLGILLMLFGIVSGVLSYIQYELKILMWINKWGETTAWGIRGGLVVLGLVIVVLTLLGRRQTE